MKKKDNNNKYNKHKDKIKKIIGLNDKKEPMEKKTKSKSIIHNRIRKTIKKRYFKSPSFLYFTIESNFIFDPSEIDIYGKIQSNLNLVKPSANDIFYLKDKIEEITLHIPNNINDDFIWVSKSIFDSLIKYKSNINEKTEVEKFIIKQLKENPDRSRISCRNLAELYTKESGKIIHKSHINNIMRKRLGLHYIKTSLKSSKIIKKRNLLFSFCFIKIIIRAIKLGFKILFQDESSILASNNNFRCWRFVDEKIYFGNLSKKRKNLLLLIDDNSVLYYKINDESTKEETFISFMEEAVNKIKERKIEKYIIVMDNLSVHKSEKLLNFYKENKINVLFNSPYCSFFNCIELAFRAIKKIIYKKLFYSIEEVENEIENIIFQKQFESTLKGNYKETLEEYIKFYELYNHISFKNLNI